jgi:acyl CoA:acetate/3-ketoacid CoA transferase alpha subunit
MNKARGVPRAPSKVMSLTEAIRCFVSDGAVVGIGGQNVSRCAMAAAHEIVRQRRQNLTLVGCNLSLHADLLVGAGCVRRIECGTANLERFGPAYQCRAAIEDKRIEVEDYDHLTMLSRFLAGQLGLPFIPVTAPVGTDLIEPSSPSTGKKFHLVTNPWRDDEQVLVVPALSPEVSIVHVQCSDELGNLVIEGVLHHEPDMIRASQATIVTAERLVTSAEIRRRPSATIISGHFVTAVVEQRFGAYPTATYGYYDYDAEHIACYQACAREGGLAYQRYLDRFIRDVACFDDFVARFDNFVARRGGMRRLKQLERAMRQQR